MLKKFPEGVSLKIIELNGDQILEKIKVGQS